MRPFCEAGEYFICDFGLVAPLGGRHHWETESSHIYSHN
eukprot:COSAG05_NODE_2900_length_2527_cov_1.610791_4_plen_38_part_01